MRRLMSFVLLVLLAGGSGLATPAGSTLLDQVMTRLSQHASVRADFTQTRTNPALAKPQQSQGTLLFVLGHGMLWQTTHPFQESLALTGNHTARLDAQGRFQRVHDARGVSQVSQMLQSLLAGQPDQVLRTFSVQASGSSADWTLVFAPRQARVAHVLSDIILHGDAFLQGIRIDLHDGSATDIRFTHTRDAGALDALDALEKRALELP